jgi:hypothetical protein
VSDTRVELRITFTVSSDRDKGREAAENAIYAIDYLATHGQLDDCYDFEVTRGSVNGNTWTERWPDAPTEPQPVLCGKYSRWSQWGGTLGPCVQPTGHKAEEWHYDANGAGWDPAKWDPKERANGAD